MAIKKSTTLEARKRAARLKMLPNLQAWVQRQMAEEFTSLDPEMGWETSTMLDPHDKELVTGLYLFIMMKPQRIDSEYLEYCEKVLGAERFTISFEKNKMILRFDIKLLNTSYMLQKMSGQWKDYGNK